MRVRTVFLASAFVAAGACGARETGDDALRVGIAPSLLFPRGLLDGVTKLTLRIYEPASGLDCDTATGKLSGTGTPIATKELGASNCQPGVKFCGDVAIAKSSAERTFTAVAQTSVNPEFAYGCAKAVANQDALPLQITMIRNVPPAVCGDGKVESTEQCDPSPAGSDPTCDEACHSVEVQLSKGGGIAGGTSTGKPGEKVNPFFLWPPVAGDGGRFLAFFGDISPTGSVNDSEVTMRVLGDAFGPLANLPASIFLPKDQAQFPPAPEPNSQFQPAAAFIGTTYYVAFQDDNNANGPDIHMRSMDGTLTAQQTFNAPIGVNGAGGVGESNIQSFPSISAGPNGQLLIAWQDDSAQKIACRTVTPGAPPTLGSQQEISSGSGNKRVALAATASGWIAVWEGGTDVKLRAIDATGKPEGPEQVVNENTNGLQDRPSIAALAGGRFAVVWSDHGAQNGADIVLQRFGADAKRVAADQSAPVNTTLAGDQLAPQIAAMTAVSGSFAVVWLDANTKHVRARLAGGSEGFLFNNVDGQAGDFQASIADGRTRANPAVTVGGVGPSIAIGWEDSSAAAPYGIIARRFPVPTE